MEAWLSLSGIVIVGVMLLLGVVLWKVAKILLIPIQILLFLALMFIAYKLLFGSSAVDETSNNAAKVTVQKLACSGVMEKAQAS